jgi:hypothetical protein
MPAPNRKKQPRGALFSPLGRIMVVSLALFPAILTGAFAGGKTEEEQEEPRNPEWVVAISAFDVSALPPYRRSLGTLAERSLADSFNRVDRRIRPESEYAYYEDAARSGIRSEAGKKLLAKRDERDQLLFRGEAEWRYRNRLAAVEEEIKKLEEEFKITEEKDLKVVTEPVFTVTADNKNGIFLPPPAEGEEYQFCVNQKADAFLTGTLSEYYGRIYMTLKMYTVYSRSFQYEDRTIFSFDDVALGMEDLAGRLCAAAAGTAPAALVVKAEPEDAFILVGDNLAGRGSTEVVEHSPGTVNLEVFAENHGTVSLPVDLRAGELAEVQITLPPVARSSLDVEVPNIPRSSVYQGSLFVGTAPLTITTPRDQYGYVKIETPDGKTEGIIFNKDWGSSRDLVFRNPVMPRPSEDKPLENARRGYYGSWGRLWIAASLTLLISGIYTGYEVAYNGGNYSETIYNQGNLVAYARIGAIAATGLVAADWIFRFIRYVYTANKDSTPMAQ